jgi:hypothetical protein
MHDSAACAVGLRGCRVTVHDLYLWLAAHTEVALAIGGAIPLVVAILAALLSAVGARGASQQLANAGIALGLTAVLIELMALAYAISVVSVNPIAVAPVALLVVPPWLLVAGFVVEHVLHPGRQEAVRRPIRTVGMALASVGVLWAIFGVLRIHMLVFSGMLGFLGFVAVLIGLFWFLLRRVV